MGGVGGGGILKVVGRGGMCFHFLDGLTLMGVSSGFRFCVGGSSVKGNATLRQYWNLLAKMGIMEGC